MVRLVVLLLCVLVTIEGRKLGPKLPSEVKILSENAQKLFSEFASYFDRTLTKFSFSSVDVKDFLQLPRVDQRKFSQPTVAKRQITSSQRINFFNLWFSCL